MRAAYAPSEESSTALRAPFVTDGSDVMKHQVLLVDDEPAVVDGLRVALRREPFATHGATSAAEALALMERVPIDVVLSDEEMPGTAGSELLARVRERHPDTVRVILTGRGSLTAAIRAINEGAIFKYLTKPCSPAEVATTLRAALAERGHRFKPFAGTEMDFGCGQILWREGDGYIVGSDPRRDGTAAGY